MTSVVTSPRPARTPVASAPASRTAVVLALAATAVGVVGIRDALITVGWVGGGRWLPPLLDTVDGLTPATWTVAAGAAAAVLGVVLMVTAVLPRPRTALPVTAASAVYVPRADIAKLARAVAADVPGVLEARAVASGRAARKVVVRCRATASTDQLRDAVTEAVATELAVLATPPRVVVKLRTETAS
jgi:hypothetical protein